MSPAPCFHPVNLPASYCSGHNPTYLLLKLVYVCLFIFICKAWYSFIVWFWFRFTFVRISVYCLPLSAVRFCLSCLSLSFALRIMLKKVFCTGTNQLTIMQCTCVVQSYVTYLGEKRNEHQDLYPLNIITCSCNQIIKIKTTYFIIDEKNTIENINIPFSVYWVCTWTKIKC